MREPRRPVAVVGPGAVGGLLAALLCRGGHDVTVVAGPLSNNAIKKAGLTIESASFGSWTAYPLVAGAVPRGAHVLVAVKAPGLARASLQIVERGATEIVAVLNGIDHPASIRALHGGTPVFATSVTVEASRQGPTVVLHRSEFLRVAASADAAPSPLLTWLQECGVPVTFEGTENEVLWRKFRFLAPMALLTTLHQQPLARALDVDPQVTADLIQEVAAIATAAGVSTTSEEVLAILHSLPASMRSSLQVDRAAGARDELDAIGGALLAAASRLGLPAPVAHSIVRRLEVA